MLLLLCCSPQEEGQELDEQGAQDSCHRPRERREIPGRMRVRELPTPCVHHIQGPIGANSP